MRIKICALLIFFCLNLKANDTLISNLINQIYNDVVSNEFQYYYLIDKSFNIQINNLEYEKLEQDILKTDKNIPFNFLVNNCLVDTMTLNWCNYDLKKVKCVSLNNIPKYACCTRLIRFVPYNTSKQIVDSLSLLKPNNEIIFPCKKKWSKKRIEKEKQICITKYEESFSKEEKVYYRFSNPIFSENKKYVMIALYRNYNGCIYIYKKNNDKWIKVLEFKCWTS